MSFSAFSSFLRKIVFQRSKNQLKNLLFISGFDFSAFQLKKTAEKQGLKSTEILFVFKHFIACPR
jgi:hypothetical protein